MVEISSADDLKAWLQDQPDDRQLEYAQVIATRAALRAVPLLSGAWKHDKDRDPLAVIVLPSLRLLLAPLVALTCPTHGEELNASANAAFAAVSAPPRV